MRGMRVYFNSLVTPGLGAAGHIRRFSKRFIKDDLPTFGYPTTPARTCQNIVKVHTQKISKKTEILQITVLLQHIACHYHKHSMILDT